MTTLSGLFVELAQIMLWNVHSGLDKFGYHEPGQPHAASALGGFATVGDLATDRLPRSRVCCALGSWGFGPSLSIDEIRVAPHEYRRNVSASMVTGGGATGYVYTARGGFIDLGHVRDYIDFTRYFAAKYYWASNGGVTEHVLDEGGKLKLVVAQRSGRPSTTEAALVGARLAYDRSVWHEIVTFFPTLTPISEKFSSFAPEDCFSNALGTLVGYRALLTPNKPFNEAADQRLLAALQELGVPQSEKDTTSKAVAYVGDFWWEDEVGPAQRPPLLRRNLGAFSPVTPWLVTDVAIPGKESELTTLQERISGSAGGSPRTQTISPPERAGSTTISNLAHLKLTDLPSQISSLMPPTLGAPPREASSADFPELVQAIRVMVKQELGQHADQPFDPPT